MIIKWFGYDLLERIVNMTKLMQTKFRKNEN